MEEFLINEKKMKFIREITAEDDLFLDRSHEKIAKSLAEIIRDSERSFRVGLQGAWGAGKSSIVKQLGKFLQDNDSEIFIFDAWAHEGDPLKRIFLESLADFLEKRNISAENSKYDQCISSELSEFKMEISGKRSTEVTVSTKEATNFTKWLSFSAITIPVGSAIFNKVKIEEIGFPDVFSEKSVHWIFILVIFLWLYPLILILIFKIFKLKTELFSSKSEEIITKNSLKSLDATSIEFEVYFKKLLQIASLKFGIDKLIIVIDNIDRLEISKAKEVFSVMQNFFFVKFDENENLADFKLWFIVPFDQVGLSKIWDLDLSNNDKGKANFLTLQSMLNKNFQLIVDVPVPRTSGWVNYAREKLVEVLGEYDRNLIDRALRTYQDFLSSFGSIPKPRDTNSFVNQLVLLKLLNPKVSIESLCWYVCMRESKQTSEIHLALLNMDFGYKGNVGRDEFVADLAAILFCVDPEKSTEILLVDEISKIAKSGELGKFNHLYLNHGEAFLHACQKNKDRWFVLSNDDIEFSRKWTIGYIDFYVNNQGRFVQNSMNVVDEVVSYWRERIVLANIGNDDYSQIIQFTFEELKNLDFERNKFSGDLCENIHKNIVNMHDDNFRVNLVSGNSALDLLKNLSVAARKNEKFGFNFNPVEINGEFLNLWKCFIGSDQVLFPLLTLEAKYFCGLCSYILKNFSVKEDVDLFVESYKFLKNDLNRFNYSVNWLDFDFFVGVDGRNFSEKQIFALIICFNLDKSRNEVSPLDRNKNYFRNIFSVDPERKNLNLMSLLAMLVFGKDMSSFTILSKEIVKFWEDELESDDLQQVLNIISEWNLLDKISEFSKSSSYRLAKQLKDCLSV